MSCYVTTANAHQQLEKMNPEPFTTLLGKASSVRPRSPRRRYWCIRIFIYPPGLNDIRPTLDEC